MYLDFDDHRAKPFQCSFLSGLLPFLTFLLVLVVSRLESENSLEFFCYFFLRHATSPHARPKPRTRTHHGPCCS